MRRAFLIALAILASLLAGCDGPVGPGSGEGSDGMWERQGPYAGVATSLAIAPDGHAYALATPDPFGGFGTTLYERLPGEAAWTQAKDDGVRFIYAGPSGRLYTGRSAGGLRWRDTDGSWDNEADAFRVTAGCNTFLGLNAAVFSAIEFRGVSYAGSHCGLFQVVDRFERVAFPGGAVKKLEALGDWLFALVDGELYRASGTLSAWERVDGFGEVRALFASVNAAGRRAAPLYVRTGDALWRTNDGATWTQSGTLPSAVRDETDVVAGVGGVLYASGTETSASSAAATAFVRSNDGGATWAEVDAPQENYAALAAGPRGWLAGSRRRGLVCGAPGATATVCAEGFSTRVERIVATPGGLFAYTDARGVYRHEADGTWTYRARQRGEDLVALGDVLAVPGGGDLARSTDGGATWTESATPFGLDRLVGFPDGRAAALAYDGALWRSGDGLTWARATTPALGYALSVGADGVLYLLGEDGQVYAETERGGWTARYDRLVTPLPDAVDEMLAVAADGTAFFRAGGEALRWDGDGWVREATALRALSADPHTGRLFAGDDRVYEWAGGRWTDLGAALAPVNGVIARGGALHAYGYQGAFVRDDP